MNTVTCGKVQGVLGRIMNDVGPSLALFVSANKKKSCRDGHHTKICILSSVHECVIVVPQETGRLLVGIVVVLKLAWHGHILCPTIPRSALFDKCQSPAVKATTRRLTEYDPWRWTEFSMLALLTKRTTVS